MRGGVGGGMCGEGGIHHHFVGVILWGWRGFGLVCWGLCFFFGLFIRSCDDLTLVSHLNIVGFSTSLAFPMSAMD
jgi:hypothetical protein